MQAPQPEDEEEAGAGGADGVHPSRACRLQLLMYRKDRRSRESRRRDPSGPPAVELSALNEAALESIQVRFSAECLSPPVIGRRAGTSCARLRGRVALMRQAPSMRALVSHCECMACVIGQRCAWSPGAVTRAGTTGADWVTSPGGGFAWV